jgi:hypothetical protein
MSDKKVITAENAEGVVPASTVVAPPSTDAAPDSASAPVAKKARVPSSRKLASALASKIVGQNDALADGGMISLADMAHRFVTLLSGASTVSGQTKTGGGGGGSDSQLGPLPPMGNGAMRTHVHVFKRGPRAGQAVWRRGELSESDVRKQRSVLAGVIGKKLGLEFGAASTYLKDKGLDAWRKPHAEFLTYLKEGVESIELTAEDKAKYALKTASDKKPKLETVATI